MKKILLTLLLLPLAIYAQVGIGTTNPNSSSMLEVDATDKGVLVPRVAIANLNTAAPVTAPIESLLVYNTTIATGVGFYYWDGAKWTPLSGAAANDGDWTVVGNDMYNANSGYVGVGTATPTAKLHIEDTSGATVVAVNDGFEDNTLPPFTSSGTMGNWSITSAAGEFNTGVYGAGSASGTDSTDSRLEMTVTIPAGGSAYSFDYRVDSEGSYDYLRFYVDDVQEGGASWSGSVAWANYAGTLTAGTHTLSWRYSKDSSSSTGLDRAFVDNISITSTTAGQPVIRIVDGFEQAGRVLTSDALGNASWQDGGDDGDWTTSGANIYNANTGNVGVGTTTPIEKLHVSAQHMLLEFDPDAVYSTKNTSTGKGYELIGSYQGWDNSAIYIGGYNANHTGNNYDDADKVICGGNTAGNVGIGTLAITATSFNVSSSERFKKNISTLEYGLDDLLKIKPVKYQYNFEKSGLYTIGFIAEEVSEVIPEIVSHQNENHKVVSREQGKPVSMDYSKMSAVLVNAVKEQHSKVQELKSNNDALKQRLARIEEALLEKAKK